jgi:hypothetical protein
MGSEAKVLILFRQHTKKVELSQSNIVTILVFDIALITGIVEITFDDDNDHF